MIVEDNKYIKDMLIGSLLGDGSIEYNHSQNNQVTISFTQNGTKEVNYINYKHDLMAKLWKVNPVKKAHHNTIRFRFSMTETEIINEMIELTRYEDNSRKLPDIEDISPVALLFWYLDDGSLSVIKQKRPGNRPPSIHRKLRIALTSFKDEDIIRFVDQFNKKYGTKLRTFEESRSGKKTIVAIGISNSIEEIAKFLDIILPYKDLIPEEMHYKFCMCYHETQMLHKPEYEKYNMCNFHNTGICECTGRNKDLRDCFRKFND